ncbi:hypothetical protein ACFYR2_08100 [Streptomyces microflavus]|uniref:hypothetical protein n=1 Tax=Streptomyces microflavus TaxID=1919 RepID=UPI0036CBBB48
MATSSPLTTDAPAGDAFCTPPVPLPDGGPGDPIRARPLDNAAAAVPGGENRLVLHRSEGADGSPVATSGVIALPDRTAHPVPAPLPGTDAPVEELTATNAPRRNIHYRRYEPGAVPADEPLGIHFATIDHDTAELTEWLAALLEDAARD